METKIDVLNHGYVRLVSYMQPVPQEGLYLPDDWSGDLEIVRNARVSYDSDWRTGEDEGKDAGLIRYMYEHQHTSPFEAMVFTFEIMVPIFVTRQWHRHRTWSYNEVSARYAELPDMFFVPDVHKVGIQDKKNKQASEFRDDLSNQEVSDLSLSISHHTRMMEEAYKTYQRRLDEGWPRERARTVLPVGIYTRFFATVDLHNLFHFLTLRLSPHAQYEIRAYAEAMLYLIEPVVPVSVDAFQKKLEQDQILQILLDVCKAHKFSLRSAVAIVEKEVSGY